MTWRAPLGAFVLCVALAGCAQGGGGGDDVGVGPGDSGTGRDTGGGSRDTSTTTPDTGPAPPACEDEGHGAACELSTDLGPIMANEEFVTDPGVLIEPGDEDWFRVDFPAMTDAIAGVGMPAIEFVSNEGDSFRFEVRETCDATLGCGDDTSARDITSWSFVDDQSLEGEEQWSARDVPWPDSIVIRVYRPITGGGCQQYQLRISREATVPDTPPTP